MQAARSLLVILTLASTRASASPLLDVVGDTGSQAGLQPRTIAGGSAATYFNPALLSDAPGSFTLGFLLVEQQIGIHLDGRPGTQFAVPEGVENFGHAGGARFDNYPIATNLLQYGRLKDPRHEAFLARPRQAAGSGHTITTYETVGIVVKLLDERVSFGFHGLIPNGQFTRMRAFFNDEREQYFSNSLHPELYSDRMTALSLALGLGVALSDAWSIGAGATFALATAVDAGAYVADSGNLGAIQLGIDASVNIGVAPHFGVRWKANQRLHLIATAHSPQKVELGSGFKFLLANGVEQSSGLKFVLDYTPWQLGLGGSYDLIQEQTQTLTFSGTALYAAWSSYKDRHGYSPLPSYAWADTLTPALGLRYRREALSASFDLSYMPTPVPKQSGRTNYVDNDRLTGGVGAEYGFAVLGKRMQLGAQFQLHRLVPRFQAKLPTPTRADGTNIAPERVKDEVPDDAQKSGQPVASAAGLQTNNPGWPGFGSGGWIMGGTIYVAISL